MNIDEIQGPRYYPFDNGKIIFTVIIYRFFEFDYRNFTIEYDIPEPHFYFDGVNYEKRRYLLENVKGYSKEIGCIIVYSYSNKFDKIFLYKFAFFLSKLCKLFGINPGNVVSQNEAHLTRISNIFDEINRSLFYDNKIDTHDFRIRLNEILENNPYITTFHYFLGNHDDFLESFKNNFFADAKIIGIHNGKVISFSDNKNCKWNMIIFFVNIKDVIDKTPEEIFKDFLGVFSDKNISIYILSNGVKPTSIIDALRLGANEVFDTSIFPRFANDHFSRFGTNIDDIKNIFSAALFS